MLSQLHAHTVLAASHLLSSVPSAHDKHPFSSEQASTAIVVLHVEKLSGMCASKVSKTILIMKNNITLINHNYL